MVLFHKLTGAENQNVITARISDGLRNQPEITASPSFNEPVVTFLNLFLLTMWKWAFFLWWKKKRTKVFSGATTVLAKQMRSNAVRQPWRLRGPGCGPVSQKKTFHWLGEQKKCFHREQEEATFHWATSRCRRHGMGWAHTCVKVCVFPCACHYWTAAL